jgi:hypothetical protein
MIIRVMVLMTQLQAKELRLRSLGLIATGPRSPQPGAPRTYVTTPAFLTLIGLPSLRDLPEIDWFEKAGLRAALPHDQQLLGLVEASAHFE